MRCERTASLAACARHEEAYGHLAADSLQPGSTFRQHDPHRDATDAHEAGQAPGVVVLEVIVQRVKPALDGLRLCACHADDESGLRDTPADLHGKCAVEYRLDVDR